MKRLSSILVPFCLLVACNILVNGQLRDKLQGPFDSYGAIGSEDASARLDNFAIMLQNQPASMGFITSYGPNGEGFGTGKAMLRITKDYLVNSRGIEADRIQLIYAGRYKDPTEPWTELWIVPEGAPPPEPRRYNARLKNTSGKVFEGAGWDASEIDECGCGPVFGNTKRAAFADFMREQAKDIGYIVAFNMPDASPGAWRRVAKREAAELQEDGIEADRIKIIYGGSVKSEQDEDARGVKLEYWILPVDAPPPVKEAKAERRLKAAQRIGVYGQYELKYPKRERQIFEGFADVMRDDDQLRVCLVVFTAVPRVDEYALPDEPLDIDESKLVEKWKSELQTKLGIKESRIFIIQAGAAESGGMVEVWVVPLGASLPDPHASIDELIDQKP